MKAMERSESTYRLRRSLAGLKIMAMFLINIWRQKPIKNLLNATLTTFSKHPWSCLHWSVCDKRASGIKCLILRRMDRLAAFFIGLASVSSCTSSYCTAFLVQWTLSSLWNFTISLGWVVCWPWPWSDRTFLRSSGVIVTMGVLEHFTASHG